MKEDILHIMWLLGKSLKALLLFDFAAVRDGFYLIYIHLTFEHEKTEDDEDYNI